MKRRPPKKPDTTCPAWIMSAIHDRYVKAIGKPASTPDNATKGQPQPDLQEEQEVGT